MADTRRLVILNASRDTCEMLEEYFRSRGWEPVSVATRDLRDGATTPAELIAAWKPDVMLVDVAIPYEENWALVHRLRADSAVTCPTVVTTTNEAAVRRLVAPREPIYEIVGKPYDLDRLHDALLRELSGTPAGDTRPTLERRIGDRRGSERRSASNRTPEDSAEDRSRRVRRG
jgi:DNA-binding response OmpR family regulator